MECRRPIAVIRSEIAVCEGRVGLSLIADFVFLPHRLLWAILIIALDVAIIGHSRCTGRSPCERRCGPGQDNRRQECRCPIAVIRSEIAVCESRVGLTVKRRYERTAGEEGAVVSRTDGRGAVPLKGAWSLSLIASAAGAAR